MSHQQFVYGEFSDKYGAARAVSTLAKHSVDPDEIDVVAVHPDGKERIAVLHKQPVALGLICGMLAGLILGLVLGTSMASGSPELQWFAVARSTVSFALLGAVVGAVAGLGFWHTRVDIRGRNAHASKFIVGTTVTDERSVDMKALLARCEPVRVSEREIGSEEQEERRDEREVLPMI